MAANIPVAAHAPIFPPIHRLHNDPMHHLLTFIDIGDIGQLAAVDRTLNCAIHTMEDRKFVVTWQHGSYETRTISVYRPHMYAAPAPVAVVPPTAAALFLAAIDAAEEKDAMEDPIPPIAMQNPILPAAPTTTTEPAQWTMRSDNMNLTRSHVRSLDFTRRPNNSYATDRYLIPRLIIRELAGSFPRLMGLVVEVDIEHAFMTYAQSGSRSLFPRTLTDLTIQVRRRAIDDGNLRYNEDEWNSIGGFELLTSPPADHRLTLFKNVKTWMTHVAAIPQLHTLIVSGQYLSSSLIIPELAATSTTRSALEPLMGNQSITNICIDSCDCEGQLQAISHARVLGTFASLSSIRYESLAHSSSHQFISGLYIHAGAAFLSGLTTLVVPAYGIHSHVRATELVERMGNITSLECWTFHSASIHLLANLQSLSFEPTSYYNVNEMDDNIRVGIIVAGLGACTQLTQLTLKFKCVDFDVDNGWHEVALGEAHMITILTPLVNLRKLTLDGFTTVSAMTGFTFLVESQANNRLENLTMRRHPQADTDVQDDRLMIDQFIDIVSMSNVKTLWFIDVFLLVPRIVHAQTLNPLHESFDRVRFPKLQRATFECTCNIVNCSHIE